MIEFAGVDIVIQRQLDSERACEGVAGALALPVARVAVIDDVGDYPDAATADVVCVRSPVDGDFAAVLSIQVAPHRLPYASRDELLQRLCELLATPFLAPDEDSANPYAMCLLAPGRPAERVALDPAAFDDGKYVIAR